MQQEQVAVITGASSGLGAAVAEGLARQGWSLVIDGRDPGPLATEEERLGAIHTEAGDASHQGAVSVTGVAGDVADPEHRRQLTATVRSLGRVDLVVLNASILGPSPQPQLADYPLDVLRAVYEVNTIAPLAILQDLTPWLREAPAPRVIAVTSDAAIEPYAGWGGYGSSKAALEQISAIWGAEQPWCRTWTVDPGDLRTRLHQQAFPGEDISDRPEPETVVPAVLTLIGSDRASGRVRLADITRHPSGEHPSGQTESGR
ncbi:MAG: SDR family oxidoreductase [Actinomycetota bacterium]|nr:SDR family oxidoreductase [Actinomycetota bacterium]